jgi:23S rRNA (uracil1939-C5)-methyltransferase
MCGGCDHMNISYNNQLKYKDMVLKEVLNRADIDTKALNIIPGSIEPYHYRNNIRFFFKLNHFSLNTENKVYLARQNANNQKGLVNVGSCLLQSITANKLMAELKNCINDKIENKSNFWQLKIREGKKTGDLMLEIITSSHDLPGEKEIVKTMKNIRGVKSIYHTIAPGKSLINVKRRLIFGSPVIYEKIGKFKFQISPESFFQTNSEGAESLYKIIKEFAEIEIGDEIVDLFCGTGSIGIYLSTLAKKVVGIEVVPEAIRDAKDNAKINKINNIEFICADANKIKPIDLSNKIIIVDPPRAGLKKELIKTISDSGFKRLIYVSCNPATFVRDLKLFETNKITAEKIQPIDMFPQTHHIEVVSRLIKSR